jgi:hypothetical protein
MSHPIPPWMGGQSGQGNLPAQPIPPTTHIPVPTWMRGQAGQGNLPVQPNFNTVNQLQQQRAAAGHQVAEIDKQLGHELGNVPIQQEQMFLTLTDAVNRLTNAMNNLNTNVQVLLATYVSSFVIFLFVSYIDIIFSNFNHLACLQNRLVKTRTDSLKRMRDVNTNTLIQACPRNIDDLENFGR